MNNIKTPEEAVEALSNVCEFFGWQMAIPKMIDEEADVPGMIIGKQEYIDQVVSHLPDNTEF